MITPALKDELSKLRAGDTVVIRILRGWIGIETINVTPSPSGTEGRYHVRVTLSRPVVDHYERILLQVLLGSDVVREALSYVQARVSPIRAYSSRTKTNRKSMNLALSTVVCTVDQDLLEKFATIIIAGVTSFIGAGSKFVNDTKKIEENVTLKVKKEMTDPLDSRLTEIQNQMSQFRTTYASNLAGWKLEVENLRHDLDDQAQNRGHGYASAVDYHSSEELVRRIEMLEVDLHKLQATVQEAEGRFLDEERFHEFVAAQNQKALEVARVLGQIEGELRAYLRRNNTPSR